LQFSQIYLLLFLPIFNHLVAPKGLAANPAHKLLLLLPTDTSMVACGHIFFAGRNDDDRGHHEKQWNVKKTTKKHSFENDKKNSEKC
jgi:hypothetical protein